MKSVVQNNETDDQETPLKQAAPSKSQTEQVYIISGNEYCSAPVRISHHKPWAQRVHQAPES